MINITLTCFPPCLPMLQESGRVLGKGMCLEQCQNHTGTGECYPTRVSQVATNTISTMWSGLGKINSLLPEILKLTQVFITGLF